MRRSRQFASVTDVYKDSDRVSFEVSGSTGVKFNGDLLVVPFYKPKVNKSLPDNEKLLIQSLKDSIPVNLDTPLKKLISDILDDGIFKADSSNKHVTRSWDPTLPKYIALVGLGSDNRPTDAADGDISVPTAQRLGKVIAGVSIKHEVKSIGVVLPAGTANTGVSQLFMGFNDASYTDNRFKKVPEEGHKKSSLASVTLLGCSEAVANDAKLTYEVSSVIASGVNFAKVV